MAQITSTTTTAFMTEVASGTTTSYLPLTSAWPSIADCSSQIWTWDNTMMVFDPTFRQYQTNTNLYCQPPEVTSSWTQVAQTPQLTTTSLGGFDCGGMYSTVASTVINDARTYVVCCPKAFHPTNSSALHIPATVTEYCTSAITSGQVVPLYVNASDSSNTWWTTGTMTFPKGEIVSAPQINGYILAAAATTTNSKPATDTTSTTPTSTSATSGTSAPSTGSGLSPSAKVGIGAGVAGGVLGLLALAGAFFLIRRYRRKMTGLALQTQNPEVAIIDHDHPHGEESNFRGSTYGGSTYGGGGGASSYQPSAFGGSPSPREPPKLGLDPNGAPYYTSLPTTTTELPGESAVHDHEDESEVPHVHELGQQSPVYEMESTTR